MKIGFQENNNGNGKLTLTADNLKFACSELGIPDDKHTLRRAARGFDLYYSGKVEHVNDHTFQVASQYDRQRPYQVTLHEGATRMYGYCTCQDWMNYSGDMDVPNVEHWCKHMISAALWSHNNGKRNGSIISPGRKRIVNESGSEYAKQLQDKLNGNNGNGDNQSPSQPTQLEISDPFCECELRDITQIKGRANGELAWTLANGETVISYAGVMKLAERHNIEFSVSVHEDTNTVIAYARRNDNRSERVSGKPVRISGSVLTATELAKRNCARQLIPYAELKALEKKHQLEAEFSWEVAYKKCAELAGGKPQCDIVINDLVNAGKLRQDNPSGYDRTEWLVIYDACQKEASETRGPKSLNNWSYNSAVFLERCREAIGKVRAEKKVEANEQPLEGGNGKRCLQMDSKLRTWLIEADGTRKAISCREIAMQFDSYEKGIIKQLRAGIDSGCDLSTVELD